MGKSFILKIFLLVSIFSSALYSQAGYAINFQNLDYMSHGDFIYCGAPNYNFTDKMTITAWVKWTTDPGSFAVTPSNHENEGAYSTYVAYGSHNSNDIASDNGYFWLRNWKTSNKFQFAVQTAGGIVSAEAASQPASGTWYFLAGVYDGAYVYLYVNGTMEKKNAQSGNIKSSDGTFRLTMGRLPWGYGFFVGHMDEVRIWKAALSQSEIQAQMTSATTIRSTDLGSYWNFNAGSGTTIDDSGPVNADGVFYTSLIDVHTSSDFPNKIISDADKTWTVNTWSGLPIKTVSGAGIDETNTVVSNTSNTLTMTYGFAGTAPNNRTTPAYDSKATANDSWYGVEKSSETSQWVASDVLLPIELTSFSARVCGGGDVLLKWQTASELNNYGFDIEKRSHGQKSQWTKIGFITGTGNSNTPKSYAFTESASQAGSYLYRLKQIDNDGQYSYSGEVYIEIPAALNSFSLEQNFPNPFNPATTIKYFLPEASMVKIELYNACGQLISLLTNNVEPQGLNSLEVNSRKHNLPSGAYMYRISCTGIQSGKTFSSTRKMILLQ